MYAWEHAFVAAVQRSRESELKALLHTTVLTAANVGCRQLLPVFVGFATFMVYFAFQGRQLRPAPLLASHGEAYKPMPCAVS